MKKNKVISLVLVLLLFMTTFGMMSLSYAASDPGTFTFDISEGSITVAAGSTADTLKVTYGASVTTADFADTQMITIIGSSSAYQFVVDGVAANITLNAVTITTYSNNVCAVDFKNNADVNLTLVGTTSLTSGGYKAGLQVPTGSSVTIGGTGTLNATGGYYGAGIGGGFVMTEPLDNIGIGIGCGTVIINSGTVNALSGGGNGAGIGGGREGTGGIITIMAAATVKAAGMGLGVPAIQTASGSLEAASTARVLMANLKNTLEMHTSAEMRKKSNNDSGGWVMTYYGTGSVAMTATQDTWYLFFAGFDLYQHTEGLGGADFVVPASTGLTIYNDVEPAPYSADLVSLSFSTAVTGYTFVGSTYTYSGLTVPNAIASLTLTPVGAGTLNVRYDFTDHIVTSGQPSPSINLTAGVEKTITVYETEVGKSRIIYTLKITRANADQAAPVGLAGVAPSAYGGSDGKITGTATTMEYKPAASGTYTTCTITETTGLAAGNYDVRYKAATGLNAGTPATVTIANGPNADQAAPVGLVGVRPSILGASDGKITGTATTMEFTPVASGSYADCSASETTGLLAGSYYVRYKAAAGFNAGATTTVTIIAGPNPNDLNSDGYYDIAFNKIQAFLNQPSVNPDKTNGQFLDPDYNPAEPTTWAGLEWSIPINGNPKRIVAIRWGKPFEEVMGVATEGLAGSLDLSGVTTLWELHCTDNRLTAVNVSGDTSLHVLILKNNLISTMTLSGASSLTQMDISINDLDSLDVSAFNDLEYLYCSENNLSELNLSANTSLLGLNCSFNQLPSLDLSSNTLINYLNVTDNQLNALDLWAIPDLSFLRTANNPLTQLKVSFSAHRFDLRAFGGTVSAYNDYGTILFDAVQSNADVPFINWWDGDTAVLDTDPELDISWVGSEPDYDGPVYSWSAHFFNTVFFDSQGGSYVDPVTVYTVAPITAPEPPTRGVYTFGGWYSEAACETPWDFDTAISNSPTLYAKWTAPALTGTATISGTTSYSSTLTATLTGGNNSGTLTYRWLRGSSAIENATDSTYALTAADIGQAIKVEITSSVETGTLTSAPTAAVAKAASSPATGATPIISSKTTSKITLQAVAGYQYLCVANNAAAVGSWQDSNSFSNLSASTAYDFYQRVKETATHQVSAVSSKLDVTTSALPVITPTSSPTTAPTTVETTTAMTTEPTATLPSETPTTSTASATTETAATEHSTTPSTVITIIPNNVEQNVDTGIVKITINVKDLPAGTTAIQTKTGTVVYLNGSDTVEMQVFTAELDSDGKLQITTINDEQIPIGLFDIQVEQSADSLPLWLWILIIIVAIVAVTLIIFLIVRKKRNH